MIPGLTGEAEMIVQSEDLASHLEGVAMEVLSTPRLVQLMEASAVKSIQRFLASEQLSLGIRIKVKHFSPTPPRDEGHGPCHPERGGEEPASFLDRRL